jgi:hypothetical protein
MKRILKKLPKIELNIVFSQHYNKEGLKEFEKLFKNSDVILFEMSGYNKNAQALYYNISKGRIKKKDIKKFVGDKDILGDINISKEFSIRRLEIIHNSQKPIFFADISENSKKFKRYFKFYKLYNDISINSLSKFMKGDFEESIKLWKKAINLSFKNSIKLREEIIKEEIVKIINFLREHKYFKNYFRNRKRIKILGHFGRAHSNIADEMKEEIEEEENVEIKKIVFNKLGCLSFNEEIIEKKKKKISIKNIDYVRVIFEIFLLGDIIISEENNLDKRNFDKISLAIKKISEKLSFSDIKKISEFKIGTKRGTKKMEDFLKERELFIPKTKKELKQILGKDYDKFD